MHLKPQQVDLVIASGPVRDEFAQKVKELDRRLKMNGMNYQQWDTLTDHQHGIFTDNLFLDGECATSPEDYVRGAVSSCGCPDVVEDLHHHSPVLMREIEKQQEMAPDMTVKISEALQSLNEFIDTQVDKIKLSESKTQRAFDLYEQKVYGACAQEGILGPWSIAKAGASPDETGPDVQIQIPGLDPAFVEVKLNLKAGMGEGSANYSPEQGKFSIVVPRDKPPMEPEFAEFVLQELYSNEQNIKEFALAIRDWRRKASYKWDSTRGGDPSLFAFPFSTTYEAYANAVKAGLYRKASEWPKAGGGVMLPDFFIHKLYARKDTFYIQVGGKGLYYLAENPLNLPVPQFPSKAALIYRPKPSGSKKLPPTPEQAARGEKGDINYGWESQDPRPEGERDDRNYSPYGGTFMIQSKLPTGGDLPNSPYTLDDPASIEALLAALNIETEQPEESEDI
jgi:hypothetical protein